MKSRVVDIAASDPLVDAMAKPWSAKEHQEEMAAEAARSSAQREKEGGQVSARSPSAPTPSSTDSTDAAGRAKQSAKPLTSAHASGPSQEPSVQSVGTAVQSVDPAAVDPSIQPPATPTKQRKVRHAPIPSTKGPTADQKRLLVKGMKPQHVVEAALFSAGKPLSTEEISDETGLDRVAILAAIKELGRQYDERDTVLEVGKAGTKWAMQVRSQAAEPAARFAPMEIAPKLLKTLALIAYHQPMKQSDLVDMVGTKAYDHVPELVERGLVRAKEEGSTKVLVTTPQFPEYFGLDASNADQVKEAMGKLVGLPARPSVPPVSAPPAPEAPGSSPSDAAI